MGLDPKRASARLAFLGAILIVAVLVAAPVSTTANSPRSPVMTARLGAKEFASVQAREIPLVISFTRPSKRFAYRLQRRQGSRWKTVRSVSYRGRFLGKRTLSFRKVFGRMAIRPGAYRLEILSDRNRVVPKFSVFRGRAFSGATSISAGGRFTCAVISGDKVECWGSNFAGELGNSLPGRQLAPVEVSGITGAAGVKNGYKHACALLANGAVNCWGNNSSAALGDGTLTSSSTPVTVTGIPTAVQVGTGVAHTCAATITGELFCWGDNEAGQLGIGLVARREPYAVWVPTLVPGIAGVTAVTSGFLHTCALISDGTVRCWGYNQDGQVGNGSKTGIWPHAVPFPVQVALLDSVVSISAGYFHTCALVADGHVYCWGYITAGDYSTLFSSALPVRIEGIESATAISSGGVHACALVQGGKVRCWGANQFGQLGNGLTRDSMTPVEVTRIEGASQIGSGGTHSCAVVGGGQLRCWGANGQGQLGRGVLGASHTPITVVVRNDAT